ncbi:MAG: hydroxyethylthiazole kinase, partial [Candidatus Diapherotrites archaeon]|nr:hydroxyethylthiazole kinase [Candidatus Diapherotrites archaeon]
VFTRGVEAAKVKENIAKLAEKLARERQNTVVVTGKEDIVASAGKIYIVKNGHELMGKFVGTGCMSASLLGCFAAVERKQDEASAAALACYGIAAELAAQKASAPAAFKQQLFDELYNLKPATVKKMQKIEELK